MPEEVVKIKEVAKPLKPAEEPSTCWHRPARLRRLAFLGSVAPNAPRSTIGLTPSRAVAQRWPKHEKFAITLLTEAPQSAASCATRTAGDPGGE